MKVYALYKKETCLAIGTIPEIADKLGLKKNTIKFYGSPTYKRRGKENRKILIKLED